MGPWQGLWLLGLHQTALPSQWVQAGQVELGVFLSASLWHANKYCSTVYAFNIAHAILINSLIFWIFSNYNNHCHICHNIWYTCTSSFEFLAWNHEVSNSILWKFLCAGRGRATPSAGGCQTAATTPRPEYPSQGTQVGAVTCARSGGILGWHWVTGSGLKKAMEEILYVKWDRSCWITSGILGIVIL